MSARVARRWPLTAYADDPRVRRWIWIVALAAIGAWSAYGIVDVVRWWIYSGGGADWPNLVGATVGNPYDTAGFRWSPVAAWVLALIVPLGLPVWQILHFVVLPMLRPWWMALVVLAWWPFWHDVMNGNVLTFAFVAAWLALTGSRPATLGFYILAMLMPRPLMLPVTAWLLWKEPWSRRWFLAIAIAHSALVLASGLGGDWLQRILETAAPEMLHPWNWLPSRWIGLAWVPIGLAVAALLTLRSRLGLASVMASPYLFPYYLLLILLEGAPLARRPSPAGMRADSRATQRVVLAGIPFDDIGMRATAERIVAWVRDGSYGYVCTPNVDYLIRASRDSEFRDAILGARLRVPDGMGVVYGARIAGTPLRQTVTGRLLPSAVLKIAAEDHIPVALFGAGPGVAQRAGIALRASGANVVEAFGPPMGFAVGSAEDARATTRLANSGAQIIFVGLGAPKQEAWMHAHQNELKSVLVGIGAGLDIIGGRVAEAPRWMTRFGLEWAFRLLHEPRRLARRYLLDDPPFFWWMIRARLARRGARRQPPGASPNTSA